VRSRHLSQLRSSLSQVLRAVTPLGSCVALSNLLSPSGTPAPVRNKLTRYRDWISSSPWAHSESLAQSECLGARGELARDPPNTQTEVHSSASTQAGTYS
jgi:hypothetical protein